MERDLEALAAPAGRGATKPATRKSSRVSSLSLVRYRTNDYSVPVAYGHREVLVKGYVDQVVISCGAEVIARHPRSYQQEDFTFDPMHYLPLLERKIRSAGPGSAVGRDGNCRKSLRSCAVRMEARLGQRRASGSSCARSGSWRISPSRRYTTPWERPCA